MVELGRLCTGKNLRAQQKCATTGSRLACVEKDGEKRKSNGKKYGRTRVATRKQAVADLEKVLQHQAEKKDYGKDMEDRNLEHRKRTMMELFGDDSLPESTMEEVDDSSFDCEANERKVSGHHACCSCACSGIIGPEEQELLRCGRCSNGLQNRCCDTSSEDSARPWASKFSGDQEQPQQPQQAVKRARLESDQKPTNVTPELLSSKCSGMNGLDLLLEVARSVSEGGGILEEGPGRSPFFLPEGSTANTWGRSPRKRAASNPNPAVAAPTWNRVLPVTAVAGSPKDPQASRSSSSAASGEQKRKNAVVGTSNSAVSSTKQWPSSSARKGASLKGGSCATAPGLVPWERMKTGNRRYRLLSSMLC